MYGHNDKLCMEFRCDKGFFNESQTCWIWLSFQRDPRYGVPLNILSVCAISVSFRNIDLRIWNQVEIR